MFRTTILILLSALPLAPAHAQTNANAKLVVHLLPAGGVGCNKSGSAPACDAVVTNGTLDTWYAYVLIQQANATAGVSAASFAIDYDGAEASGIDIFSWSRCAVQEFREPGWPAAGTGNFVYWDASQDCQRSEAGGGGTGVVAVAGYFYLAAYGPDDLSIISRSGGPATVTDCSFQETQLASASLGSARFSASGGVAGYNPCFEAPPPTVFSCSITGSTSVPVAATEVYAVQTSHPVSSYAWTVTGNGTIVGSATGSSVSVVAGNQGSFSLSLRFNVMGGGAGDCQKTVTVVAPSCSITGFASVPVAATAVYGAQTSHQASNYAWTVTGNGTIVGSTTGSSVSVLSGNLGTFNLALHFNVVGGGGGDCQKTVTVAPVSLQCSINGPNTVLPGTTGHIYTISTVSPAVSYQWIVSGGSSIVGSSTGPSIVFTAGLANPLNLIRVYFQALGGGTGNCEKWVDVPIPSACPSPCGPDEVLEGSLTTYSSDRLLNGSYLWGVIGNGAVEGTSGQQTARIRAGFAVNGAMTVWVADSTPLPVAPSAPASHKSRTVTILPTPPAPPGANDIAALLLHVRPPVTNGPCGPDNLPSCLSVNTSGALNPSHYFAYVVAAGAFTNGAPLSGIGGFQFGIQYDGALQSGVDILSWTACGATETPSTGWPEPGTGNRVTWDTLTQCQVRKPEGDPTASALAGYFYLTAYSPDQLRITPRPEDGIASIEDCLGVTTILEDAAHSHSPSHLGVASFSANGDVPGYNPCSVSTLIVPTTWSRIKTQFR